MRVVATRRRRARGRSSTACPSGSANVTVGRQRNVTPRSGGACRGARRRPTVRPSTLPPGRPSPTPTSWWPSVGRCRAGRSSRRCGRWRAARPLSSLRPTARRNGLPSTPRPGGCATRLGRPNDPVVVSVDPRDEEHSLVLALRRLATDARLRADLGRSARAWWAAHATIDHAVAGWLSVINDAATLPVPARPDGWPAHLHADGSRLTRQILAECGLERVPGDPISSGP